MFSIGSDFELFFFANLAPKEGEKRGEAVATFRLAAAERGRIKSGLNTKVFLFLSSFIRAAVKLNSISPKIWAKNNFPNCPCKRVSSALIMVKPPSLR